MRQLMDRRFSIAFAILVVAPAARGQIEEVEMRAAFFDQTGSGYQSAAGPARGPGSENALIFEPLFHLKIRQDEAWSHSIDITASYRPDNHRADVRYGFHIEEPFRSLFLGGGYTWFLADDNAAISVSG